MDNITAPKGSYKKFLSGKGQVPRTTNWRALKRRKQVSFVLNESYFLIDFQLLFSIFKYCDAGTYSGRAVVGQGSA